MWCKLRPARARAWLVPEAQPQAPPLPPPPVTDRIPHDDGEGERESERGRGGSCREVRTWLLGAVQPGRAAWHY